MNTRRIDKNWDALTLTGLLLFMLLSRNKQNIAERELALIEDSTDLQEMNGFISDANVKALFVSSITLLICRISY